MQKLWTIGLLFAVAACGDADTESVCDDSAVRCDGRLRQTLCGGQWRTQQVCASAALCADDGCGSPPCTADQLRCSETGLLQRCAADQATWESINQCAATALCDPTIGCTDVVPMR